ncbi:hypothetical protein RF638_02405 [Kocuria sp. CPCC 205235]|uniref:rhomboid-like protein n=1 Tax=Kocuria sp. CPCC 205235 TaxID=3073549 RepID=UPI0034D4D1B2
MITLAAIVLVIVLWYAVEHHWPGTAWFTRWREAHGYKVRAWLKGAPATYLYLGLLTFTTWLLSNANGRLRVAFLSEQSTTLRELATSPVTVLIRSALYVSPLELIVWWVLFTLVAARLEHSFGSARIMAGFAIGHVGASLAVALLTWGAISTGQVGESAAGGIDVGASYGFAALAALFTYLGSRRRRFIWAAVVVLVVAANLAWFFDGTALGHAIAALLGFACYPLVRPAARRRHMAVVRARRIAAAEEDRLPPLPPEPPAAGR